MKKILFLAILFFGILLTCISCEGPSYTGGANADLPPKTKVESLDVPVWMIGSWVSIDSEGNRYYLDVAADEISLEYQGGEPLGSVSVDFSALLDNDVEIEVTNQEYILKCSSPYVSLRITRDRMFFDYYERESSRIVLRSFSKFSSSNDNKVLGKWISVTNPTNEDGSKSYMTYDFRNDNTCVLSFINHGEKGVRKDYYATFKTSHGCIQWNTQGNTSVSSVLDYYFEDEYLYVSRNSSGYDKFRKDSLF